MTTKKKRNLFEEIKHGILEIEDHKAGMRTLEKWEQGKTVPNDQAGTLIMMVRKFPDTLERLEKIDAT